MGALAIILARAGSKGLPRKNVLPVAGRPCIAWTIDDARRAEQVDRIVVSTDGEEIASVACAEGVEVAMRPDRLAVDDATVDDAARHVLEAARLPTSAHVVLLYANVPVRPPGLIDEALHVLDATGCDSVQTYAPVGKHHPWWTAVVDESTGAVRPWEGDVLNHAVYRRQDLPPAHIPDGGAIALTQRALRLQIPGVEPGPHAFLGADRRGVVSPGAVVDIDSEIDLLVADAILGGAQRHEPAPARTG